MVDAILILAILILAIQIAMLMVLMLMLAGMGDLQVRVSHQLDEWRRTRVG